MVLLFVGAVVEQQFRRPEELGTMTETAAAEQRVESFCTTWEWA